MSEDKLYGMSAAARAVGVSEETMRKYSDSGIVQPMRDSSGRRIFTDADIERAKEYRARGSRSEGAGV